MTESSSQSLQRYNSNGSRLPSAWNENPALQQVARAESIRGRITSFLDLIGRRKYLMGGVALAVIALVTIVSMVVTPRYDAVSWVIVDLDEDAQISRTMSPGTPENVQFVRRQRSLEGEILLLEISNPLARRVAERLLEIRLVPGTDQPLSILTNDEGEVATVHGVASYLTDFVEFEPEGEQSNVIRITASAPAGGEATLIANLYADEYVHLTREANRAHLSATRGFLEEQEEKWRRELYEAEEQFGSNPLGGTATLDERGAFLVEQAAALEAQRDQLTIDLQMRRASLASIERELERINPQLAERIASSVDQEIERVRTRIADLEMRRKEILLRYPGVDAAEVDHPELQQIESQLRTLRDDLTDLSNQYVKELESTGGFDADEGLGYVSELRRRLAEERIAVDGMEAQAGTLGRRLQSYVNQMASLPDQSLRIARLERTRQHASQMYESVVSRLQEVLIAEQSEPGYARIIRDASIPESPAEPNLPRNLALGFVFGILLGAGGAVFVDKADNRLFNPDEIGRLGTDAIAIIPSLESVSVGETTTVPFGDHKVAPDLVALVDKESAGSEAFRQLRTVIQFSGDRVLSSILVTSASMSEGKSTVAANLAAVMAQSGRKTLLLDGDLRRPRVHDLFGMSRSPGLTDIVDEDIEKSWEHVVMSVAPNLSVITAGASTDRPSEVLGSKRLSELMTAWEAEFDVIIVDSPPVRAATDPVLLSTQCDGTVIVARAGSTKHPELQLAVRQIRNVGGNIVGVVLNSFEVKMAYGFKYMYSKYDQYSKYSKYSEV